MLFYCTVTPLLCYHSVNVLLGAIVVIKPFPGGLFQQLYSVKVHSPCLLSFIYFSSWAWSPMPKAVNVKGSIGVDGLLNSQQSVHRSASHTTGSHCLSTIIYRWALPTQQLQPAITVRIILRRAVRLTLKEIKSSSEGSNAQHRAI